MVLAFLDQGNVQVLRNLHNVPEKATCFRSPESLSLAAPASVLDEVRENLSGMSGHRSETDLVAARRLWYFFELSLPPETPRRKRKVDAFGNHRVAATSPIELLQLTYVVGSDPMVDHFHDTLPNQARQIVSTLQQDGRGIWTGEEAAQVAISGLRNLESRQNPRKIFDYYRSILYTRKILKKVSYVEYSNRVLNSGVGVIGQYIGHR